MRITITTTDTATTFLRRAGYGFQKETSGEIAFVRRVGGGMFPRYHAYVQERPGQLTINLHVDQKAPTYGRNNAHSGEYEGALVEEEVSRLRSLTSAPPPATPKPPEPKKGFFGKLFG
ncbi:MAG: hypothetical protein Q7S02_00975 [bacterium]|nr:hypothetical protein [bacterium]